MEEITLKMFVSTCDYLTHLLEEIMTSSTEIPEDTFLSLNDLMAKLLSFMSHVYRNNSQENIPTQTRITTDGNRSMNIHPQAPISTLNTAVALPPQYGNSMSRVLAGYRLYQIPPYVNAPLIPPGNSHVLVNPPNLFRDHYQPLHQQAPVLTTNNPNNPNLKVSRNTTLPVVPAPFPAGAAPLTTMNTNIQSNAQLSTIPPQPINIDSINDSTQLEVVNQSEKCEVPVKNLFEMFTTSVLNNRSIGLSARFYCQLCDLLCSHWSSHALDVMHKEKCTGLKKLAMKSCLLCGIYLYGKKNEITQYFKYHFEKNHLDSKECPENWKDVFVSVDITKVLSKESLCDKDDSIPNSSSNAVSNKPKRKKTQNKNNECGTPNSPGQNSESLQENRTVCEDASAILTTEINTSLVHTDKVSTPSQVSTCTVLNSNIMDTTVSNHTHIESTCTDEVSSKTNAESTDIISICTDEIIALPAKNHEDSPSLGTSPYSEFDLLIKVVAKQWIKSSILSDVGFCDICQLGIKSGFDWFDHTSDHKSTGDASWKEEICPKCHIKIYGLDHQKYFSLISHCKLDEMIG